LNANDINQLISPKTILYWTSVRRRGKNVDSPSKSNPLMSRRGKKIRRVDVKAYRRRRRKNKESRRTFNKNSCMWFTYSSNAHRAPTCSR